MIISIRLLIIITAIVLLVLDFLFYATKRLGETYGMLWLFISIFMLLGGILKKDWSAFDHVDSKLLIPLLLIMGFLVIIMFIVTVSLSVLTRQNHELAIHVSLLNQENEILLKSLSDKELTHEEPK
ncbi:MAG: DUF2304 family protein [Lachnospiraceae bacterium]|nr:DUF2304 family protein [Lachnospiraceae bacterium]